MPACAHPPQPMPAPLRGVENPSFARDTILQRLPKIARVTLEENDFSPGTINALRRLIAEIPVGPIRLLDLPLAPDAGAWQEYIQPYLGLDWMEIPWFFAESYFYARILEATGYFHSGPGQGADPFARQKQSSLSAALQGPGHAVQGLVAASNLLLDPPAERPAERPPEPPSMAVSEAEPMPPPKTVAAPEAVPEAPSEAPPQAPPQAPPLAPDIGRLEALTGLLHMDLFGNQVDLSRWPGAEGLSVRTGGDRLLVDHAREAARYLLGSAAPGAVLPPAALPEAGARAGRVDFLVDNAGFELVADLCLADFLLNHACAAQVVFHLKQQPVFVSDAMVKDVHRTLDMLAQTQDPDLQAFTRRIRDHLEHSRLHLRHHPFWTSPLAMWQAPAALLGELNQARLVICKGDALYRRLLGDRHWSPTTSFRRIVCYLEAPLLALRTLKSEVAAGLRPGQAEAARAEDADWMTDGRWALIQWTGGENTV